MFEDDNCLSTSQLKSLFNMFVDGNWYIVQHELCINNQLVQIVDSLKDADVMHYYIPVAIYKHIKQ
jgi:hypothetical protein